MNSDELYLNGKLIDTGGDLSVRLNRKLIDPGALNTVDAQYSYTLSLPWTQRNVEALGYANVEETRNKFNKVFTAELIINSVRIFPPRDTTGLFRLTSITETEFKGNLYIPAKKNIKDIFGDIALNANPPYYLAFNDFSTSTAGYNAAAESVPQPAIFPYVLYGVLPKTLNSAGVYTARNLFDGTVRIGMQDLPASINPMLMLKHIFNSAGYSLGGTAFQDKRLTGLYMSYKNDTAYVQPWNWGLNGKIHVTGAWDTSNNVRTSAAQLERNTFHGVDYCVDLLDADNTSVTVVNDPGSNVTQHLYTSEEGHEVQNTQIYIPVTGYYKVQLNASLHVQDAAALPTTDNVTDVTFISAGGTAQHAKLDNNLFELRICRDNKQGDFGLSSTQTDGAFDRENQPQNNSFTPGNMPKYYPQVNVNGQINFIDKAQDENVVAGFMFGKVTGSDRTFINPKDSPNKWAQVYAAKPALSWNNENNTGALTKLAINSPGWWRYTIDSSGALVANISNKYAIELDNAPLSYAKRGQFNGTASDATLNAQGNAALVVWLEAGELITVAAVSSEGVWQDISYGAANGFVRQNWAFDLQLEPFRNDKNWLQVNSAGDGTGAMNWNDTSNYMATSIDLVKFLDASTKTNDFIDNFCKAFNLALTQTGSAAFSLDIKQVKNVTSARAIDLDMIASVDDRENAPLGLPSKYVLGFTINTDEEGFIETGETGGGEYTTGATEENVVTQTSAFSYDWFKSLTKVEFGGNITINVPIISRSDVWDPTMPYVEALQKRYTDLAYRFWYPNGNLQGTYRYNGALISLGAVRNAVPGLIALNYHDEPQTILSEYFTLLISGASHYTNLKGFLTAIQYMQLDGSRSVRYNGDIYYAAELSGFDPYGRNQTTIKLIRRI